VLLSRFVLAHRLLPSDPLAPEEAGWEASATKALLETRALTLRETTHLLV
jgi:hypothetical protein